MFYLFNNRGFVINVCFSLKEVSNDCKMLWIILLEDLNKWKIIGNG